MIKKHETWDIIDASKLQAYMTCPRMYFYNYILGWQSDLPNIHLIFGEAWHKAMEHLLVEGYNSKSVGDAFEKFLAFYNENSTPEMQDKAKNPENAFRTLVDYVSLYKHDNFDVIATEIAGTVPVSPKTVMHFRIDAIIKGEEGYYILEHKTGSRGGKMWIDQWLMSMQLSLYIHCLYCKYKPEEVYGAKVNGAIFKMKDTEFIRVPIRKNTDSMERWLATTITWLSLLENDTDEMTKKDWEKERILLPFRMNTQSCTKYGTCKYLDFCNSWSNPLHRADTVPLGFCLRWWDPREAEKEAKEVVRL